MHLVAQLFERHVAIARWILQYQLRERFFQRSFRVIQPLELKQVLQQRAPLAFTRADREQHQHRVVARSRNLHSPAVQKLRQNCRRNSPVSNHSLRTHARRQDGHLCWVEHAIIIRNIFVEIAVPILAGFQRPSARLIRQQAVGSFFK